GELNTLGTRAVGIIGMAGVGKTHLAVEFAYRFGFAFDHVFWLDATLPGQWRRQIAALARDGLKLDMPAAGASDADEAGIRGLADLCRAGTRVLLVMDNVPDPALLNDAAVMAGASLLDLGPTIAFTSRVRADLPSVAQHTIGTLSNEASLILLTG